MIPVRPPETPVKRRHSQPTSTYKLIGEGSFYKIYETAQGTAVRIAKKAMPSSVETEILQKISHPCINKMIKFWSVDDFMHFEMELCRGGTLKEKIDRMRPPCLRRHLLKQPSSENSTSNNDFSGINDISAPDDPFSLIYNDNSINNSILIVSDDEESSENSSIIFANIKSPKWVVELMYQLSSALSYLHSNNIVHMDIKPSNVLIDQERYQLCDFNIAAIGEGLVDLDGDSIYMAPEILKNKYFFASDVFSLGLLYLEVCNLEKKLPSKGEDYRKLRKNNFSGWRVDQIARRMLDKQHQKRCTSLEVKEHFEKML